MSPINLFKRRVASSHESKAASRRSKLDDTSMSTSLASTRTETTVASEISDETREDLQRSLSELPFSEDEDDWRNDFLSPGSAISKDLEKRPKKNMPLSPVASQSFEESSPEASSSPSSPSVSFSEASQQVTTLTSVEKLPNDASNECAHVERSSNHVSPPRGHSRHRSMIEGTVLEKPIKGHRRSMTLSPTSKPPSHRRSSSMTTALKSPSHSPVSGALSLDSLYATMEMRIQRFGPCHFTVGQTWNLIGNHHFRAQEHEKAIKAYEESLKCKEGCQKPRDADHIAAAYGNIGTVCWSTGDMTKSIAFLEKALKLRMESEVSQGVDPERSLPITASYHQLGLALSLNQEYEKAMDSLKHALRIREKVLGRKSVDIARSLDAIGKIHLFQGEPAEALLCHQEAYAIKVELTGENGPGVTASLANIAAAHLARKFYNDAILAYLAVRNAQALEMQKGVQEGNPNLARLAEEAGETSQMLIDLFTKTESYSNAKKAVDETLKLYQEAGLKEDHPKMQTLKESVKHLQKATLLP